MTDVPASISSRAGQYAFTVTTAANCAWSSQLDVSWADVTPPSGQGSARPTLRVDEHTRFDDTRSLTLTVAGQTFRVVQDAAPCVYSVTPQSLDVTNDGGRRTLAMTTGSGCAWTVTSPDSWISVVTTGGAGSANVHVDIARNTGDARQGVIILPGHRITVTQARG